MRAAIVENGIVVNVAVADKAFAIEQGWIPSDSAQIGWIYNGKKFSAPAAPQLGKAEVLAAIAAKRFTAETGGITVQGLAIDTSRDSQNLITGAALAADRDPAYSVKWKTAGGFVELSAAQLLALADAVRKHVQACFNREADLAKAVDDGTYQAAMLEQGWPV